MTPAESEMDGLVERLRRLAEAPATVVTNGMLSETADAIERLTKRIATLERMDREAAEYVEDVICMRTDFTGEPPYVGWKGLGLALTEALDERDAAHAAGYAKGLREAAATEREACAGVAEEFEAKWLGVAEGYRDAGQLQLAARRLAYSQCGTEIAAGIRARARLPQPETQEPGHGR